MPLIEIEKELAAHREKAGKPTQAPNGARVEKGKTTEVIAPKIGVAQRTIERAMTVMQKAKPEEKEQLRSGESYLQLNP